MAEEAGVYGEGAVGWGAQGEGAGEEGVVGEGGFGGCLGGGGGGGGGGGVTEGEWAKVAKGWVVLGGWCLQWWIGMGGVVGGRGGGYVAVVAEEESLAGWGWRVF